MRHLFVKSTLNRMIMHTVTKSRKMSTQKNKMLLMKNPQFLPNQADILPSEFIHWTDILTKFHNNWTKIVDFLVIAFYFPGWTFFWIWSQCGPVFGDFTEKEFFITQTV